MQTRSLMLAASLLMTAMAIQTAAGRNATEVVELAAANTSIYPSGYFDRYSPRTALDLVARVPGFVIDYGSDRRGFDDAGGNVLIDGARAQSKSGGLQEALERIPAKRVERVELVTNPTMAAAAGKTVILNVVLRAAEAAGTWQISQTRARDGSVSPWANASYAAPLIDWQTSVTAEIGRSKDPNAGSRVRRDRSGAVTLVEDERRNNVFERASMSLEATRSRSDSDLILSARLAGDTFEADTLRRGFPDDARGATGSQKRSGEFVVDNRDVELGLTYRRPLMTDWRLEALTLARWAEREEASRNLIEVPEGLFSNGARSLAERENGEWIARSVITAPEWAGWRPEFGGELVYNRMDAALDLVTLAPGGVATPLPLPSANVIVDEWRAETFLNVSRTLLRDWTIDAGLAFESSNIAVRGGAQASEELKLVKPSIAVAWKPSDGFSMRGALRRDAGQLDFQAFAASAELGADRTFGGNPELRPDATTRLSLDTDYRVGSDLAFSLEIFHEWRQDVSEPIVLSSGDFGAGNAGNARAWGASLRASKALPLDVRVDLRLSWQDAAFRDSISGVERPVSGLIPLTYGIELRQDFRGRGLSWGARLSKEGVADDYYVAELQSFDFGYERSVYLEATLPWNMKATLAVREPGSRWFVMRRSFYTPTRAGTPSGTEWRRFERGPDLTLTIERRI